MNPRKYQLRYSRIIQAFRSIFDSSTSNGTYKNEPETDDFKKRLRKEYTPH